MVCIQNKEAFMSILLTSGMVVCLFLMGCKDKSVENNVDHKIEGDAYFALREYDQAVRAYTKAIEINPRDGEAYYFRGNVYHNKGEHDKAWEDVHKAQRLGLEVPPELLKGLREASGREK